jgi:cell division septum initiation protein DivIVA
MRSTVSLFFLTAALTAFCGHSAAQTISVDAWKRAADEEGPKSIVYSDLRSDAENARRDQDRACGLEFTCTDNDKFRGNAIIDAQKTLRDNLKDIEGARSSGKLTDSQYREAIDRVEERLSKIDEQRRLLIEEAGKREEIARECARARRVTMLSYQKYLERLDGAERDSDNKDAVEFIRKLQKKTKDSIEEHVRPHDIATKAAAGCRSAAESLGTLKKLKKGDL